MWPWPYHTAPTCAAGPRDDHDETALAAAAAPFPIWFMTESPQSLLDARKRELRRSLSERRRALEPAMRAAKSRAAAWNALLAVPWQERPNVALFWPLADEMDTLPLLHALHWLGAEPLLPRMQGRGRPLVFHRWQPGLELVEGPFRVYEPPPGLSTHD